MFASVLLQHRYRSMLLCVNHGSNVLEAASSGRPASARAASVRPFSQCGR